MLTFVRAIFTHFFKRKDIAVTMATASKVKVGDDRVIDPALLFQRFLIVSETTDCVEKIADVMEYKLCPYPFALFETPHVLRKAETFHPNRFRFGDIISTRYQGHENTIQW